MKLSEISKKFLVIKRDAKINVYVSSNGSGRFEIMQIVNNLSQIKSEYNEFEVRNILINKDNEVELYLIENTLV